MVSCLNFFTNFLTDDIVCGLCILEAMKWAPHNSVHVHTAGPLPRCTVCDVVIWAFPVFLGCYEDELLGFVNFPAMEETVFPTQLYGFEILIPLREMLSTREEELRLGADIDGEVVEEIENGSNTASDDDNDNEDIFFDEEYILVE